MSEHSAFGDARISPWIRVLSAWSLHPSVLFNLPLLVGARSLISLARKKMVFQSYYYPHTNLLWFRCKD